MSKASAMRWFQAHDGRQVDTVQFRPNGSIGWAPGPRTVKVTGNRITLDGSAVTFGTDTRAAVAPDPENSDAVSVMLEWFHPDSGDVIHRTIYRAV